MNKKRLLLISGGLVLTFGLVTAGVYAVNNADSPSPAPSNSSPTTQDESQLAGPHAEELGLLSLAIVDNTEDVIGVTETSYVDGKLNLTLQVDSALSFESVKLIAEKSVEFKDDFKSLTLVVFNKDGAPVEIQSVVEPAIGADGWIKDGEGINITLESLRTLISYVASDEVTTNSVIPEAEPVVPVTPNTETPAAPKTQTPAVPQAPAPVPAPAPPAPAAPPAPVTPPVTSSNGDEGAILAKTNAKRAENGLPALTVNSKLTAAAALQAEYQATNKTMTHDGNGGLGARVSSKGYTWCALAENVAMGYGSADAVFTGWVNSPGHLANILSPNVTEMGLALAKDSNGTPYWAQVFGKGC